MSCMKTAQWQSNKRSQISICIPLKWKCLFLGIWVCLGAQAQRLKPLSEYLDVLETTQGVSFSYNEGLLGNLSLRQTVDVVVLAEQLGNIEEQLPITVQRVSDGNYLLLPIRKTVKILLQDRNGKHVVPYVYVSKNGAAETFVPAINDSITISSLFITDTVLLTSSFYQALQIPASELLGEQHKFFMEPMEVNLQEVEVSSYLTNGIDLSLSDQSLKVDMRKLGLLAGEADGDVFNLIKTMPGVQTPSGKPGSMSIRNSPFDHSALYFDDIPIYHTGHFFGTISPYNPQIIRHIDIQRGTQSPEWGGRVGGLISLKTDDAIHDSLEWGVSANTVYSGARVSMPLLKKRMSLSLSARTGYPNVRTWPRQEAFYNLNFQGSKINPDFANRGGLADYRSRFYDVNAKLSAKLNSKNYLFVSGILINDRLGFQIDSDDPPETGEDSLGLSNGGVNLKWRGKIGEKFLATALVSSSTLTISETVEKAEDGRVEKDETFTNRIDDNRASLDVRYFRNEKSEWKAGYLFNHYQVEFSEYNFGVYNRRSYETQAGVHAVFLQAKETLGKRLIFNTGIRLEHYSLLNSTFLDPRVLVSYKLGKRLVLKGSVGRSHQYIMRRYIDDFSDFRIADQIWSLADEGNPILEGYQATLGGVWQKGTWTFDIEGYAKQTHNVMWLESPRNAYEGSIGSFGIDVFLKKSWKKWEAWTSYTLSRTNTEFLETQLAHFDQTHGLNVVFLYRLKRWNFSVSWQYLSGMPVFIPEIDPDRGNAPEQLSIPYANRFPAQHQLDASITHKFWKKKGQWRGIVGLSAVNLYNQPNIINVFQKSPSNRNPYRMAMGFAPNLHVSLSF